MVLGIGEGNLNIEIDRKEFKEGEKIKGILDLKLNSPKKAKELRVRLIGERYAWVNGNRKKQTIRFSEVTLGGEKKYDSGIHNFELEVPNNIYPKEHGGIMGTMVSMFMMFGLTAHSTKFYVEGTLSLPMSLDIGKKIEIKIKKV